MDVVSRIKNALVIKGGIKVFKKRLGSNKVRGGSSLTNKLSYVRRDDDDPGFFAGWIDPEGKLYRFQDYLNENHATWILDNKKMLREVYHIDVTDNMWEANQLKDFLFSHGWIRVRDGEFEAYIDATKAIEIIKKIVSENYDQLPDLIFMKLSGQNVEQPKEQLIKASLKKKSAVAEEIKNLSTHELQDYIDKAYESGAPQEDLDALEDLWNERVSEEELGMEEGIGIEKLLSKNYQEYLDFQAGKPTPYTSLESIVTNMRSNIFNADPSNTKTLTDEQILDAAKDAYETMSRRIERLKKKKAHRIAALKKKTNVMEPGWYSPEGIFYPLRGQEDHGVWAWKNRYRIGLGNIKKDDDPDYQDSMVAFYNAGWIRFNDAGGMAFKDVQASAPLVKKILEERFDPSDPVMIDQAFGGFNIEFRVHDALENGVVETINREIASERARAKPRISSSLKKMAESAMAPDGEIWGMMLSDTTDLKMQIDQRHGYDLPKDKEGIAEYLLQRGWAVLDSGLKVKKLTYENLPHIADLLHMSGSGEWIHELDTDMLFRAPAMPEVAEIVKAYNAEVLRRENVEREWPGEYPDKQTYLKNASIIDYPHPGLDRDVWDQTNTLLPQHKDKILAKLNAFFHNPEKGWKSNPADWITDIFILGSLTSYQYHSQTDIDVHIHVNLDKLNKLEFGGALTPDQLVEKLDAIRKTLNDTEKENLPGTTHPIEYFFEAFTESGDGQTPAETRKYYTSAVTEDGIYDLEQDKWTQAPRTVDKDFDPDKLLTPELMEEIVGIMQTLDILVGDIERNLKTIEQLEEVVKAWPPDNQKRFLDKIDERVAKIDAELREYVGVAQNVIDNRHKDYSAGGNSNLTFKALGRFTYLLIGNRIKKLLDKTPVLTPDSIPEVKKVLELPSDPEHEQKNSGKLSSKTISRETIPLSGSPREHLELLASLKVQAFRYWMQPDGELIEMSPDKTHDEWFRENYKQPIKYALEEGWILISDYYVGCYSLNVDIDHLARALGIASYGVETVVLFVYDTNVTYWIPSADITKSEEAPKDLVSLIQTDPQSYLGRFSKSMSAQEMGIYKQAIKPAFYLTDYHSQMVWSGEETKIIKARMFKRFIGEERYLASRERVYGIIALEQPEKIDVKDFDKYYEEHRVTKEERERWWPDVTEFYLYPFRFEPFRIPRGWTPIRKVRKKRVDPTKTKEVGTPVEQEAAPESKASVQTKAYADGTLHPTTKAWMDPNGTIYWVEMGEHRDWVDRNRDLIRGKYGVNPDIVSMEEAGWVRLSNAGFDVNDMATLEFINDHFFKDNPGYFDVGDFWVFVRDTGGAILNIQEVLDNGLLEAFKSNVKPQKLIDKSVGSFRNINKIQGGTNADPVVVRVISDPSNGVLGVPDVEGRLKLDAPLTAKDLGIAVNESLITPISKSELLNKAKEFEGMTAEEIKERLAIISPTDPMHSAFMAMSHQAWETLGEMRKNMLDGLMNELHAMNAGQDASLVMKPNSRVASVDTVDKNGATRQVYIPVDAHEDLTQEEIQKRIEMLDANAGGFRIWESIGSAVYASPKISNINLSIVPAHLAPTDCVIGHVIQPTAGSSSDTITIKVGEQNSGAPQTAQGPVEIVLVPADAKGIASERTLVYSQGLYQARKIYNKWLEWNEDHVPEDGIVIVDQSGGESQNYNYTGSIFTTREKADGIMADLDRAVISIKHVRVGDGEYSRKDCKKGFTTGEISGGPLTAQGTYVDRPKDAPGYHTDHPWVKLAWLQKSWLAPDGRVFEFQGIHEDWVHNNLTMLQGEYGLQMTKENSFYTLMENGWVRVSRDGLHFIDIDKSESAINSFLSDNADKLPEELYVDVPGKSYSIPKDTVLDNGMRSAMERSQRTPDAIGKSSASGKNLGAPLTAQDTKPKEIDSRLSVWPEGKVAKAIHAVREAPVNASGVSLFGGGNLGASVSPEATSLDGTGKEVGNETRVENGLSEGEIGDRMKAIGGPSNLGPKTFMGFGPDYEPPNRHIQYQVSAITGDEGIEKEAAFMTFKQLKELAEDKKAKGLSNIDPSHDLKPGKFDQDKGHDRVQIAGENSVPPLTAQDTIRKKASRAWIAPNGDVFDTDVDVHGWWAVRHMDMLADKYNTVLTGKDVDPDGDAAPALVEQGWIRIAREGIEVVSVDGLDMANKFLQENPENFDREFVVDTELGATTVPKGEALEDGLREAYMSRLKKTKSLLRGLSQEQANLGARMHSGELLGITEGVDIGGSNLAGGASHVITKADFSPSFAVNPPEGANYDIVQDEKITDPSTWNTTIKSRPKVLLPLTKRDVKKPPKPTPTNVFTDKASLKERKLDRRLRKQPGKHNTDWGVDKKITDIGLTPLPSFTIRTDPGLYQSDGTPDRESDHFTQDSVQQYARPHQ